MRLTLLLLATLLVLPLSAQAEEGEPTLDDVKAALLDFLPDADGPRGRAKVKAWGEKALPHLMDIAFRSRDRRFSHHLTDALVTIGGKEAADLFVLILEGKTRIDGFHALTELTPTYTSAALTFSKQLKEHKRFKAAVLRHAQGTFRGRVVNLCGTMRWTDQVPLVRSFLKDEDLDVREAAARALRVLTGETAVVERPKSTFPGERLLEGLLGQPRHLPGQGKRARRPDLAVATRWLDGTPRLVCAWEPGIDSLGDHAELRAFTGPGEPSRRWPLPLEVEDFVVVPSGEQGKRQIVALVSEEKDGRFTRNAVIAWSALRAQRWRRQFETLYLKDLAVLHGEQGPMGVALGAGGDDGIVAMDFEGRTLWQVPKTHTTYRVVTHARLPGFILHIGGDFDLHAHKNGSVRTHLRQPRKLRLFVKHGVLFPSATGTPTVVLAGTTYKGDVPTLVALDEKGTELWRASLPHKIQGLTLLETKQHGRLLVLTTRNGDLLLLSDTGVLRWRGVMPEVEEGEKTATYQLAAGEVADGVYAVLVRLLGRGYYYPVNLDALGDETGK